MKLTADDIILPDHLIGEMTGLVFADDDQLDSQARLQLMFGGPPLSRRYSYYEHKNKQYCYTTTKLDQKWWAPLKWASWVYEIEGEFIRMVRFELHELRREAKDQAEALYPRWRRIAWLPRP